jgi:hypothetical protein
MTPPEWAPQQMRSTIPGAASAVGGGDSPCSAPGPRDTGSFLLTANQCFAIVRFKTAPGGVRDVVGLFRNPAEAAGYIDEYRLQGCQVVPATAVVPRMP